MTLNGCYFKIYPKQCRKKYYSFNKIWLKTAEVLKLKIGKTRLKMPNEYVLKLGVLNSQESQIY